MRSCIIVKRYKKCHIRNYKRSLKHGKSRPMAKMLCWSRNHNIVFAMVLILLSAMSFSSCSEEPVVADVPEIVVAKQEQKSDIVLDNQMQSVSKYIYSKQKTKSIHISNYIAYSLVDLARINNISIDLLVGLIQVESRFDPLAVSNKNAKGLMQVCDLGRGYDSSKKTYKETFDQSKIFDVRYNLTCGINIFKDKVRQIQKDRTGKKNKYKRSIIEQALFMYVGSDENYIDSVLNRRHEFLAFFILDKEGV